MAAIEVKDRLPQHRVPASARKRAEQPALEVVGLVQQPRKLNASEIEALPSVELAGPFRCEEGWTVPDLVWRGPRLLDVLALARPLAAGRWVRVTAGPYSVPLALADGDRAVLAVELNGQRLTAEHGAPWRLVAPEQACFESVKWVERLEVVAEPGDRSGEAIARRRLNAS